MEEIYGTNGITQMGSSTEKYMFNTPGKVIIKIESSQDPRSFSQYSTIVYKNPNPSSSNNINNFQNVSSPSALGLITSYFSNLCYVYICNINSDNFSSTYIIY